MSHPNPLMLTGNVDERDELIESLQERVSELEGELRTTRGELARVKADSQRAVGKLRHQLQPLYSALRAVFGEMDALGAEEQATGASSPKWESLKQRLSGRAAEMIDLLLTHDSLSVRNLMALMHCGKDAVYQAASKLGQAGAVTNTGGRYSLKDRA